MIPHPQIDRARDLFRRVYRNQKIDLKESKLTLRDQLDLYLDHLSAHLDKKIAKKDHDRIYQTIERNNQVAKILESPAYRRIIKGKRALLGDVVVGVVFCIDGRIPTIFLRGRYAKHWEEPAGERTVIKRKSDGKLVPESAD